MLNLFIRRPIGVSFAACAVVLLGLVSFDRLPVRLLPDVEPAVITIVVDWPGHSPERVEDLILREMQHQLGTLSGITEMNGQAALGRAVIRLTFQAEQAFEESIRQVHERLGYTWLPSGASVPLVLGNTDVIPALTFAISAQDGSEIAVASLAVQDELVPLIEGLDSVAQVRLRGVQERELLIEPDPIAMQAAGINLAQLGALIEDGASQKTLGKVHTESGQSTVALHGGLRRLEDLEHLVLGPNLALGDVAHWQLRDSIPEELVLADSGDGLGSRGALVMEIVGQGSASLLDVSAQVQEVVDRYGNRLDMGLDGLHRWELPGAEAVLIEDRSLMVSDALGGIRDSIIFGGLISLGVLLLFLRQMRPSAIVFIAVPISVIATFLVMSWAGVSVNLLSLTGLALGIGMLVDNAIVVIESASRAMAESRQLDNNEWYKRLAAAISAVAPSIIASTLTTLAVFLPLTMLPGELGDLLFDQSFTICVSLMASLIVAICLVPPLVAWRPDFGRKAAATSVIPLRCMGFELVGIRKQILVLSMVFVFALTLLLLGVLEVSWDRLTSEAGIGLVWPSLAVGAIALCILQVIMSLWQSRFKGTKSWRMTNDGVMKAQTDLPSWSGIIRALPLWFILSPFILIAGILRRLLGLLFYKTKVISALIGYTIIPCMRLWDASMKGLEWVLDRSLAFLTPRFGLSVLLLTLPLGLIALIIPQLPVSMLPSVPVQRFSLSAQLSSEERLETNLEWVRTLQQRIRARSGSDELIMLGTVGGSPQPGQAIAPGANDVELLIIRSHAFPDIKAQREWMAGLEATALDLGALTVAARADNPLAVGVEEAAESVLLLRGQDARVLVEQSDRVAAAARALGAGGVELSHAGLQSRVVIKPNDLFLSEHGITLKELSSQVTTGIDEFRFDSFRPVWAGNASSAYTLPIRLRAGTMSGAGSDVGQMQITSYRNLEHLAEVTDDRRPALIEHRNALLATQVSIERLPVGYDGGQFVEAIKRYAPLPASVELIDQGVDERAASGMRLILMSFAFSVFLVFVVMTAQFESLIQPLLVMISVPLSVAGALVMLWLANSGIDGMSAIGMIILAGIAVNNAIVLVTTYNQRPEKDNHIAARKATVLRLRPILMTTCTTICSLIPMLLGTDPMSAVRQPLALALIGGLLFSACIVVLALPGLLVLVKRPNLGER